MKDVVVRKTASHHRIVPNITPGVRRTYPEVSLVPSARQCWPLKAIFHATRTLALRATLPVPNGAKNAVSVEVKVDQELRLLSPDVAAYIKELITKVALVDQAASTPEQPKANKKSQRKKNSPPAVEATPLAERRWLTVKEIASIYPFTEGALRHLIWAAEARAKYEKKGLRSNGFLNCIVRPSGRKVLINTQAFQAWLSASAGGVQ